MDELRCPKCDKNLSVISKGYVCSRECGFAVWNMFAGKKLSNKVLEKLISDGVTPKIKGFLSAKNGKEFDAAIHLDDDFKMRFKFD
jgi:DNA topoisomerase-3